MSPARRARAIFVRPDQAEDAAVDRSGYNRLAIPFTFKPQLTLLEAVIATTGAVSRIFIASLLFAVWGTYSLVAWPRIPNVLLRLTALLFLLAAFALSLLLTMGAISVLMRNRRG